MLEKISVAIDSDDPVFSRFLIRLGEEAKKGRFRRLVWLRRVIMIGFLASERIDAKQQASVLSGVAPEATTGGSLRAMESTGDFVAMAPLIQREIEIGDVIGDLFD